MAASTPDPRDERIVRLLVRLTERLGRRYSETAEAHELTPQQGSLLRLLEEPASMRHLAGALRCDASNITGLVDRLEARHLVQRSRDPADRRVTLVSTTPVGRRARAQFQHDLFDDLPLEALDEAQRGQLLALLEVMVPDPEPAPPPGGGRRAGG